MCGSICLTLNVLDWFLERPCLHFYHLLHCDDKLATIGWRLASSCPHYSDVTWMSAHLISPVSAAAPISGDNKEHSKLCITCPLWGESTGYQWIPPQSASTVANHYMSWYHHKFWKTQPWKHSRNWNWVYMCDIHTYTSLVNILL